MHYAPNVSNEAVGGYTPTAADLSYFGQHGHWPDNVGPFVIFHGPHGYMIQFLGAPERVAINKEYEAMLARLCKIKTAWCLKP
jgi:hypothetical protein